MAREQLTLSGLRKVHETPPRRPLTTAEVREVLSDIESSNRAARVRAATLLPLYTGLSLYELTHLQRGWLFTDDGLTMIVVPESEPCSRKDGDASCGKCNNHDSPDYFETEKNERSIPVPPAIDDTLEFLLRSHSPLVSESGVQRCRADLTTERSIAGPAWRHTYGVILATKGSSRREIGQWMGIHHYGGNTHRVRDYEEIASHEAYAGLAEFGVEFGADPV